MRVSAVGQHRHKDTQPVEGNQSRQSFSCHRQAASNARLAVFLDRFDAMSVVVRLLRGSAPSARNADLSCRTCQVAATFGAASPRSYPQITLIAPVKTRKKRIDGDEALFVSIRR